jgi:hypothetical protein
MAAQFPVPPPDYTANVPEWCRKIARSVIGLMDGKHNATGTVTLTASATSTTLTDRRLTASSVIAFMPRSNNAATAMTGLYVSARTNGSATLSHASSNTTDMIFDYAISG